MSPLSNPCFMARIFVCRSHIFTVLTPTYNRGEHALCLKRGSGTDGRNQVSRGKGTMEGPWNRKYVRLDVVRLG